MVVREAQKMTTDDSARAGFDVCNGLLARDDRVEEIRLVVRARVQADLCVLEQLLLQLV